MYGAIIGDIAGSIYEHHNFKTNEPKTIELINNHCRFTDDTVLTCAVAEAVLGDHDFKTMIHKWGNIYPHAGYGSSFRQWLNSENPQPYQSWGNGSAMRVSAIGWIFDSLATTQDVAKCSAECTHNHHEGVKGAQAVASAIYMARNGESKEDIKQFISRSYGYNLDRKLDEIRPNYRFDVSCQGSVPEAIVAFLESENFTHAIQLAISIGGDSDTIACITGSIAEAFYKNIPKNLIDFANSKLSGEILAVMKRFYITLFSHKQFGCFIKGYELSYAFPKEYQEWTNHKLIQMEKEEREQQEEKWEKEEQKQEEKWEKEKQERKEYEKVRHEFFLDAGNVSNVIYAEYAQPYAMGNAGGVIVYAEQGNKLYRFEASIYDNDDKMIVQFLSKNADSFQQIYGGCGNHVFINKNITLETQDDCFVYHKDNTSHHIYCSVQGVFDRVCKELLMQNRLQRFLDAQQETYLVALDEIKHGKKQSHWMWYIFPQIDGLGSSSTSRFYAIKDLNEAESFLLHPILGARLTEISKVLLSLPTNDAHSIFGSPDDLKLRSCMTLFLYHYHSLKVRQIKEVQEVADIFQRVLDKFFDGKPCEKTLELLGCKNSQPK